LIFADGYNIEQITSFNQQHRREKMTSRRITQASEIDTIKAQIIEDIYASPITMAWAKTSNRKLVITEYHQKEGKIVIARGDRNGNNTVICYTITRQASFIGKHMLVDRSIPEAVKNCAAILAIVKKYDPAFGAENPSRPDGQEVVPNKHRHAL
jgi:hypothetical protein